MAENNERDYEECKFGKRVTKTGEEDKASDETGMKRGREINEQGKREVKSRGEEERGTRDRNGGRKR